MRVAWISHNSDVGGAELCLIEAADALSQSGIESHVILPWSGELEPYLEDAGLPVSIHLFRWWVGRDPTRTARLRIRRAFRNLAELPALVRLLRDLDPDLVITNTLATPAGAFAARLAGIPHLWYIHEFGAEDMGLPFDWGNAISGRIMNRLGVGAVVVSDAVEAKFSRWIPTDRIRVVYNAVEMPERPYVPIPEGGAFRFVVTGAKHKGKRQEDAIRALAILRERGVDCHLTLAGREDPNYGKYLRELVAELGVEEDLSLHKFVPDAFAEIENAHVFVMPSRAEAFGRVTIEAMKLGRPVVGTDRAGTAEFIQDGWNGLLYEPENPFQLADRLERLSRDRKLLEELGENARQWATERCNGERYAQEFEGAVRELSAPAISRRRG